MSSSKQTCGHDQVEHTYIHVAIVGTSTRTRHFVQDENTYLNYSLLSYPRWVLKIHINVR